VRKYGLVYNILFISGCTCFFGSAIFWSQSPSIYSCNISVFLVCLGFQLINSSLIAREILVFLVFKSSRAFQKRSKLNIFLSNNIHVALILICIILLMLWLSFSRLNLVSSRTADSLFVVTYCSFSNTSKSIWRSIVLIWLFLQTVSVIMLAFLNRNLPESFNISSRITVYAIAEILFGTLFIVYLNNIDYTTTNQDYLIIQISFLIVFGLASLMWRVLPIVRSIDYASRSDIKLINFLLVDKISQNEPKPKHVIHSKKIPKAKSPSNIILIPFDMVEYTCS
jgi:hypothetical protein